LHRSLLISQKYHLICLFYRTVTNDVLYKKWSSLVGDSKKVLISLSKLFMVVAMGCKSDEVVKKGKKLMYYFAGALLMNWELSKTTNHSFYRQVYLVAWKKCKIFVFSFKASRF
jgi:hypothetical protein